MITDLWERQKSSLYRVSAKNCVSFRLRRKTKTLGVNNKLRRVPSLKPATQLAILYADRCDRRKSPGVPGAAIGIFKVDRHDRRIKSLISGMSDIGDLIRRLSPSVPFPRFSTFFAANRQ